MMSKNGLGLVVGLFLALLHFIWSILVAIMPETIQNFFLWVFSLHHIAIPFAIVTPFVLSRAIVLVILTFITGYITGWVLGALRQMIMKKKR